MHKLVHVQRFASFFCKHIKYDAKKCLSWQTLAYRCDAFDTISLTYAKRSLLTDIYNTYNAANVRLGPRSIKHIGRYN